MMLRVLVRSLAERRAHQRQHRGEACNAETEGVASPAGHGGRYFVVTGIVPISASCCADVSTLLASPTALMKFNR